MPRYLKASDPPSEIKRKLSSGFHQVARYFEDYNEPGGYLLAFSESKYRLNLELDMTDGWPLLHIGGRAVYFIEIWTADSPTASKLGKASNLDINRDALLNTVEFNTNLDNSHRG